MRELIKIARITLGRIAGCMLIAWLVYNPWYSLVGWLGPQVAGNGDIEHAWPFKLLLALVAVGIVIGLLATIKKALGLWWGGLVAVVASVAAFLPFYEGWVTETGPHAFYAAWFFVLPVLAGCALSSGYLVRYVKGIASVQGHVSAEVTNADHSAMPEPHEAHEPTA